MKFFLVAFFIACIFPIAPVFAQQRVLNGFVRDSLSGEAIIGANIRVQGLPGVGTSANPYGFYSLALSAGQYMLEISSVGYQKKILVVNIQGALRLDIQLQAVNQLETVEVHANSLRERMKDPQMGINQIPIKEISRVPVLFGEQDVLKTIQLLPGVSSAGEGSSGFFVRGGTSDQNLILLDEATVYNASHLMGFFSTFNSDAIKDVNLYKGNMPAWYGGRLSSVLDVHMKEGNRQNYETEGGVGLIASRLKVEGPLFNHRGSFMVSGRRTYADLFLKLLPDSSVNRSALYFYDLNLKGNYQVDQNNALYASAYLGQDVLGYARDFRFDWGNVLGTLRWSHVFNAKLFSNSSLIYSRYKYHVGVYTDNNDLTIRSKIQHVQFKQDFQYEVNAANRLRFGLSWLKQEVAPVDLNASEESDVNSIHIEKRQGLDIMTYLSHDWKVSEKLSLQYGARAGAFLLVGPGEFYQYDADGDVIQSRQYGNGKVVKGYWNIEPRFAASYVLNGYSSLKASYARNAQNLHQLTNTTSSLPTDAWALSSNNVHPQLADQGSLGYYHSLQDGRYELSGELYYKYMQHQIDYRNSADITANEHVEAELVYGVGKAYGLELLFKKNMGKLHGWIGYTLSRSKRKFNEINEGEWFAARQDRIHDFSVVALFQLSDRWSLSGTFVYNTGNAVTFPSGKYEIGERSVWYYTERNGYRMPDYHRLDLGAVLQSKPGRTFRSSWTFGLYNVYNRKNAYFIDFRENKENPNITEAYQIALFGIIPSVTWNFAF